MNHDDAFKKWVDWEFATGGGREPFRFNHRGHQLRYDDGSGWIGGSIQEISVDENQKAIIEEIIIGTIGSCGHVLNDNSEVAGQCQSCQGIACKRPGCMEICDLENILVCRNCYTRIYGVVVSHYARRGLWLVRLLRIRNQKKQKEIEYGYPQLPYDPS